LNGCGDNEIKFKELEFLYIIDYQIYVHNLEEFVLPVTLATVLDM
jgi:hypothetical protein